MLSRLSMKRHRHCRRNRSSFLPASAPARERGALVEVVDVASKAIVNIRTEEAAKGGNETKSTSLFKRFFHSEADEDDARR